jgi:flagellar biogenesis protein FliO
VAFAKFLLPYGPLARSLQRTRWFSDETISYPTGDSVGMSELMTELGRMGGALLLLVAGIVGVALLARRFLPLLGQKYRPEGTLQHLGLLALTPQCSVALVRAGQETLILGLTPHSVTLLTKSGEPANQSAIRDPLRPDSSTGHAVGIEGEGQGQ